MAQIDAFFKLMNEQGASDLHLVTGQQPVIRINGELTRIKYKILENDPLKEMLYEIAPEEKVKLFEETGDVDFAYEIPGLARYRANFFDQKYGIAAVFREILSAPARRISWISWSERNPPPTVKGIKTLSATSRTMRVTMLRRSDEAVMSRNTSSSAPSAS